MGVNLYASRVVLKALGAADYGLYSIVGGLVVFLGFINLSMTAASQRFLGYAHGLGDREGISRMFNSVLVVHVLLGGVIFLIGEAGGLIYINRYLNVAPDKIPVAHLVFQFALLSFVVKTVTVPYHASIIANERMSAFAWISIIEGLLQLSCAVIISYISSRRLAVYATGMFISVVCIQSCYRIYAHRKFHECRYKGNWERKSVKEIFSYSGWNLMGSFSSVAIDQGVNMVLNSFFGVVVNAARGIAFQVSAAVSSLAGNMQQAMNPQIVKSYAAHDTSRNFELILNGTRICFFLMMIPALAVMFNLRALLGIWLEEVPDYTYGFCMWAIGITLLSAFSNSLITGAMATGRIKRYQLTVASINLLNIPISIMVLHIYPDPYMTFAVMALLGTAAFVARLLLASKLVGFAVGDFMREGVAPCLLTLCIGILTLWLLNLIFHAEAGWMAIIRTVVSVIAVAIAVGATGLKPSERQQLKRLLVKRFCK